jgi:hypothetical protein
MRLEQQESREKKSKQAEEIRRWISTLIGIRDKMNEDSPR